MHRRVSGQLLVLASEDVQGSRVRVGVAHSQPMLEVESPHEAFCSTLATQAASISGHEAKKAANYRAEHGAEVLSCVGYNLKNYVLVAQSQIYA
mmetsp:Transcript_68890/g.109292  ORF Transcript_68890/g.109292 Transcript_68890/m.109292 type:complete len:94 (+) Transcript_68890:642-923(+)